MTIDNYLSLADACRLTGLTMTTIWRHCNTGAIKSVRKTGRRFILDTDIRDWILAGGIKPVGQPKKVKLEGATNGL